jgi:hypothetical protein
MNRWPERPANEPDLLNLAYEQIVRRLPRSWSLRLEREPPLGRYRPDALLELRAPDGRLARLLIEAKSTLNTRDVPPVLSQLRQFQMEMDLPPEEQGPPLVVARYIAPRTQQRLLEWGASYADATGNIRIEIERPAVFIEAKGATADPWRGPERETRTLRGKPAMRVVRALLDFLPPIRIRQLSELSGASLGSTYRVVDFLEREAILERDDAGAVKAVDWRPLIERWSEDYDFNKSNIVRVFLEPRGLDTVINRLKDNIDGKYAITGSVAANRIAPYAESKTLSMFVENIDEMAERLALRESPSGTNVVLAVPYDPVAFERSIQADELCFAATSQVVVDLMSGPGRSPSEAEALLDWMSENEREWRRTPDEPAR